MQIELNVNVSSNLYYSYQALSNSFMNVLDWIRTNRIEKQDILKVIDSINEKDKKESDSISLGRIIDDFVTKNIDPVFVYVPKNIREQYNVKKPDVVDFTDYEKEMYISYKEQYYNDDKQRWDKRPVEIKEFIEHYEKRQKEVSKLEKYNEYLEVYNSIKKDVELSVTDPFWNFIPVNKQIIELFDNSEPELFEYKCNSIIKALKKDKFYNKLLEYNESKNHLVLYQQPLVANLYGVECKGLADIIIIDIFKRKISIIDVKTTEKKLGESYKLYKYFRQLGWYKYLLSVMFQNGSIKEQIENYIKEPIESYRIDCYIYNIDTNYFKTDLIKISNIDLLKSAKRIKTKEDDILYDLETDDLDAKLYFNATETNNIHYASKYNPRYIPCFKDYIDQYKIIIDLETTRYLNYTINDLTNFI